MFANPLSALATLPYQRHGFEVLGVGYNSVVVAADNDSVKKFHPRTLCLTTNAKKRYINRLYRKQNILKQFFDPHMVCHQDFSIEPFPLNTNFSTVVSTQPRHSGTFLSRKEALSISEFRQSSRLMHDEAKTLPDLVGRENVLIPDGQSTPVIIDTIPLEKTDPADFLAYFVARRLVRV